MPNVETPSECFFRQYQSLMRWYKSEQITKDRAVASLRILNREIVTSGSLRAFLTLLQAEREQERLWRTRVRELFGKVAGWEEDEKQVA